MLSTNSLAQQIVKDINENPGSFIDPENVISQRCFTCGDYVYFRVNEVNTTDLWKTDGTEAGTVRLISFDHETGGDLLKSLVHEDMYCANNILYFRSIDGLWKSDGTREGTVHISYQWFAYNISPYNDKMVYRTDHELWMVDGNTVSEIKKFDETVDYFSSVVDMVSTPFGIIVLVGVFTKPDRELLRVELWKSDATNVGTVLVSTFTSLSFSSEPLMLIGNKVIFPLIDNSNDIELWVSDGTETGTTIVTTFPDAITVVGTYQNKLVFLTDSDSWISDGTAGGTEILIPGVEIFQVEELNDDLYLAGFESFDNVIYKSDGTPEGTIVIGSLGNQSLLGNQMVAAGDKLIAPLNASSAGIEIGIISGSPDDISLLKDINSGAASSNPRCLASLGSEAIFVANDGVHGYEVWKTDGTVEGTVLVKDVIEVGKSSDIESIYSLNDKLYFLARENGDFSDLWVSDGTGEGTQMALDLENPEIFGLVKDQLIIFDEITFIKTDGTLPGTHVMQAFTDGGYNSKAPRLAVGDNLLFDFRTSSGGDDLWKANIVTNEVVQVKDIFSGNSSSGILSQTGAVVGDKLIFPAKGSNESGEEIWVSDGTTEGTFMLKDINPISSSAPGNFTSAGDKVFFTASNGASYRELWVTGGTSEGTKRTREISASFQGAMEITPARLGTSVVFAGIDSSYSQPWISDGTEEGTRCLRVLNPQGSNPSSFTAANNNKVYFVANDGVHGNELFVTDGTEQGTLLIDVVPGIQGSDARYITPVKDAVYFYSNGKIYRTMGTLSTTEVVAEIEIKSGLYSVGNYLCFLADDTEKGRELFRIDVTKFPQEIIFPIITGVVGDSIILNIASTSGLPVSVSTTSDKVEITSMDMKLLSAGRVTITATQSGNDDFAPVDSLVTFCVNPQAPEITTDLSDPAAPVLTSSSQSDNRWFLNGLYVPETGNSLVAKENGTYRVRVSVEGCVSTFSNESLITTITGIDESEQLYSVYPNPVFRTLHAIAPLGSSALRFQITDVNGKIVSEKYGNNNEAFDVSALKNGHYILRITNGKKVMSYAFIKE